MENAIDTETINKTNNNAEVQVQNLCRYPTRLRRIRKCDKEELCKNFVTM